MAKKKKTAEIDISAIKRQVREIVESAVESTDFTRLTYDSAGKPLVEGIAVGIRDNGYMAADAMKAVMKELDLQLQLGAISADKYYKYMEEYRNSFFTKGTSGWWEYTEKILEHEGILTDGVLTSVAAAQKQVEETEKMIEASKKRVINAYTEIAKQAKLSLSELTRAQETMRGKLDKLYEPYTTQKFKINDDGLIFENGVWMRAADKVYSKTSVNSLEKPMQLISEYTELLEKIKSIGGVPEDFFRMLRDLPVEQGITLSSMLLREGEDAVRAYAADWEKLQGLEDLSAAKLFSSEFEELRDRFGTLGDDIVSDLKSAIGTLPDGFLEEGKLSAEELGSGFNSAIGNVMTGINDIIAKYTADISIEPSSAVYNSSYTFYGSGQTVAQQLADARLADTVDRLRGR